MTSSTPVEDVMFLFQIITNVIISLATVGGNYFVLRYYWISRSSVVSMLYSTLSIVDSLGAVTGLLQVVSFTLADAGVERQRTRLEKSPFGFYCFILVFLFAVVSRVSCFLNSVLAATRAICVWKPFYRIKYRLVCLSIGLYTLFWVIFMVYVGVAYFILHQKTAIQCVTTNECIVGVAPPDIVYGIPYILPTVAVMASLGVTMFHLQKSKGFLRGKSRDEQAALREAAVSRTTRTIIILSVVFLVCNVTFSIFGFIMFIYSKTTSTSTIDQGLYAALFFLSHYTIVYVNGAINPAVLIYRSGDLRQFTVFEVRRLLSNVTCGRIRSASPTNRRESMMLHGNSRRLSTTRVSVTHIPTNFRSTTNRSMSSPSAGSGHSLRKDYTSFRHQSSADVLQVVPRPPVTDEAKAGSSSTSSS